MVNDSRVSSFQNELKRAVNLIRQGAIVGFPTETFYGLAADPFCQSAISSLFSLKRRAADKPILTLIEGVEQLPLLVESIPPLYEPLIDRYWPGPLTLIFPAKRTLSTELTGGTGTIGIRISSHPLARELVGLAGIPLTATSANISGYPAPQTAHDVTAMFGDALPYVLDGGRTAGGLSSTVVGLSGGNLLVLRQGVIRLDGHCEVIVQKGIDDTR